MIQVSQKSRYALRALFELAKQYGHGPVRIADIAERQAIPKRFLESILNQLRQANLVRSLRGSRGGYELARPPEQVTVGETMRVTEGSLVGTGCVAESPSRGCPLYGRCVFKGMWERASGALAAVYDAITFQELVEEELRDTPEGCPLEYVI